jgi:hypothetical protein
MLWISLNIHLRQMRETWHEQKKRITFNDETDWPYVWEYSSILRQFIEDVFQNAIAPVRLNMDQCRAIEISQKTLCRQSNRHRYIFSGHFHVCFVRCEWRWQDQQSVFGRTEHENSQYQFEVNIGALKWMYDSNDETRESKVEMLRLWWIQSRDENSSAIDNGWWEVYFDGIRVISAHAEPSVFLPLQSNNAVLLLQSRHTMRSNSNAIARERERAIVGCNVKFGEFCNRVCIFYQQINTDLYLSFDTLLKHDVRIKAACDSENSNLLYCVQSSWIHHCSKWTIYNA